MAIDVFDELEARVIRIEETLQIAGGPLIGGALQHANIVADSDKHEPKLHAARHERSGVDEIKVSAIQTGDLEIIKSGPSFILDDGVGGRFRASVNIAGNWVTEFWDTGGSAWVPLLALGSDGTSLQDGDATIRGNVVLEAVAPSVTWKRDDGVIYSFFATGSDLQVLTDTGSGPVVRVVIPKDGFIPGDIWVSNDAGVMVQLPIATTTGHILVADLAVDPKIKWVANPGGGGSVAGNCPIGGWLGWAGSGDPGLQADTSVFFIADGRALLTGSYPDLFAVIGYLYGGSGGTFNLPDFQGKFALGADPGNTGYELADAGGALGHTHPYSDVPQHTHTASGGNHSHGFVVPAHAHGVTDGGHTHTGTAAAHNHTVNETAHNHTITDGGHGHTGSVENHSHSISDPTHTHSTTETPHDHQSGSYVTAGHTHDNGTLETTGRATATAQSGTGVTNVLRDVSGAASIDVVGATASGSANIQGTSGTRNTGLGVISSGTGITGTANTQPALTVNPGATGISLAAASTGISLGNATPTLSINPATTGISIASGGGHTGTSDTSTVPVTVNDAGVASPVTEATDPAFLATNIVIRVQ